MVPTDPKYTVNAEFLLRLLAAWLKGESGAAVPDEGLDAQVLREIIQQNRLEPLFYLLAPTDLPPASAAPLFAASITPGPPPEITLKPFSTSSRAVFSVAL